MMRSMSSAVSGLKAMQTAMDVIGNNIANVNTTGFKKSRVVFSDTLYQAMQGASSPTDTTGGTNPMAIGLGAAVASVQQIHTAASASSTSSTTDMAIDGDGYFIMQDAKGQTCYSRAGNFTFDTDGNLVNSDGFLVMGWVADATGTIDTAVSNMRSIDISSFESTEPYATSKVEFVSANLDAETTGNDTVAATPFVEASDTPADGTYYTMQKEYFDTLGNKSTVYYRFFKVTNSTTNVSHWDCDVSLDSTFSGTIAAGATGSTASANTLRYTNINFNTDGSLDTTTAGTTTSMSFIIDGSAQGASATQAITFDLTGLTQYSADSDYNIKQDGYTAGSLTSISVGTDGVVTGTYDNGTSKSLVQVALASFQNPSGLIQAGSNTFLASVNSGDAQIGTAGNSGLGTILPSSLEASNVDLSEEFTDMITTQRGFQANSRIITTSDSMLEELVNLKRS